MPFKRVQARQKGITGYINCQRGTWLGSPFPLNHYRIDRSIVLFERYFQWRLENDYTFKNYWKDLYKRSKTQIIKLGCTCKEEENCHVESIIRILTEWFNWLDSEIKESSTGNKAV